MIHVNHETFKTKRGNEMRALGVITSKKILCLASDSIVIIPIYILVDYDVKYKKLVFKESDTQPLYRWSVELEKLNKKDAKKIIEVKAEYNRGFYHELSKLKNQLEIAIMSSQVTSIEKEKYKKMIFQICNLKI